MQKARSSIIFYTILLMMVSLFLSRAALSVSMLAFLLASFISNDWRKTLSNFFHSPLLWGITLLFLIPFISFAWSSNIEAWLSTMRIKLPLLLLPIAFARDFRFSRKQWQTLATCFILIIFLGTAWTMWQYLQSPEEIQAGYLRSQTITTPLEHDHVRFSWLVTLAILVSGWLLPSITQKRRPILLLTIAWFIAFLHILAARTGLVGFYLILLATITWLIIKAGKPKPGLGLLLALLLMPLIAYFAIPTFQNRIKFIRYDFGYLKDGNFLPGGNDATRMISFKAGLDLTSSNLISGTGFGDIRTETENWYASSHPEIPQEQRILPSSQWLIYGVGCGIPGIFALTLALIIPFFTRVKRKAEWIIFNLLLIFPFLYDIGLEVQFGVVIYCLSLLLTWKWVTADEQKK